MDDERLNGTRAVMRERALRVAALMQPKSVSRLAEAAPLPPQQCTSVGDEWPPVYFAGPGARSGEQCGSA